MNIPADLAVWQNDPKLKDYLSQKGLELVTDEEARNILLDHLEPRKNDHPVYKEQYRKLLEEMTFVATRRNGDETIWYFYWDDRHRQPFEKAWVFSYEKEEMFLGSSSLIETVLFDLARNKIDYNRYRKELEQMGIRVASFKEHKKKRDKAWQQITVWPNELLEELNTMLTHGRRLKKRDEKISEDLFKKWANPRYGTCNPTLMDSPLWREAVVSRNSAYRIAQQYEKYMRKIQSPLWSFDRFGKSVTWMPDGREIHIGGEHEDSYDPDFFIYNDVTVIQPDDSIVIYGYPREVFPPADFHSATPVEDSLVIIGRLGYHQDRQYGTTPVYLLDTTTFRITKVETEGTSPGWIHNHTVSYDPQTHLLTLTGGKVDYGDDKPLFDNGDTWTLDTQTWRWQRLTKNEWTWIEFKREDGGWNRMFDYHSLLFAWDVNWHEQYESKRNELEEKTGLTPDLQRYQNRYVITRLNNTVTEEDYETYITAFDGIPVTITEEGHRIMLRIEGLVAPALLEEIERTIARNLEALEGCRYLTAHYLSSELG